MTDAEVIASQLDRVLTEVRVMRQDVRICVEALERAIRMLMMQIATLNDRIDQFDQRVISPGEHTLPPAPRTRRPPSPAALFGGLPPIHKKSTEKG